MMKQVVLEKTAAIGIGNNDQLILWGRTKSTHSTPRAEAWGVLRFDTERRFLPRFKKWGLAPSNVSREEDIG
jgi:hypothetical protein